MRLTTANQLRDVFSTLDKILGSPQVFGLRQGIPPVLGEALRTMRDSMEQVLRELPYDETANNLEVELSQDADSVIGR